jgi:hypothetical protein
MKLEFKFQYHIYTHTKAGIKQFLPGMVAHICNPTTPEPEARGL